MNSLIRGSSSLGGTKSAGRVSESMTKAGAGPLTGEAALLVFPFGLAGWDQATSTVARQHDSASSALHRQVGNADHRWLVGNAITFVSRTRPSLIFTNPCISRTHVVANVPQA